MSALSVKKRMKTLAFLFLVILCMLIVWLVYQNVAHGAEYRKAASQQQTKDIEVSAKRGTIFDRNGKQLAVSISADTVILDPSSMQKEKRCEAVASCLSEILGMPYEDVYAVTQKNSSYEILKKRITQEQSQRIREKMDENEICAIYLEEDTRRSYVYGSLAANILGFTGYDNQGLNGIEMMYDSVLSGKPGRKSVAVANGGVELPYSYEKYVDSEDGESIVLTIDETMQHIAETRLFEAVEKYGVKEDGCCIIMEPKTGEVLAMASTPGYDPNDPFTVYDDAERERIEALEGEERTAARAEAQNHQWRNKAISDTYEPGSVFKMITAASAIEENAISQTEEFDCPGSLHIGGWDIKCWRYYNPHGMQNVGKGLANSCNCVFMKLGLRLGSERFRRYVQAFGFEEKTGIDLPGESEPIIRENYGEVDVATASFGQNINVTPIQMITAASAVVNGGELLRPRIIKEYRDSDGNVTRKTERIVVRRVISESTSEAMRGYLEGVVRDGTGSGAKIAGQRVGGKTGTSEKQPRDGRKIASFCGFAPANDPQVIILLMLDEPTPGVGEGNTNGGGGAIAAPTVGLIMNDILHYLGIEGQYSESEILSAGNYIPDFTGMSVASAREAAQNKGFAVNVIGAGATITDQQPKGGIMLNEGATIILYTEGGSDTQYVTVPDVVGMSTSGAKSTVEGAGLNFRQSEVGAGTNGGAISVGQTPAAGTTVERGSIVYVKFMLQDLD